MSKKSIFILVFIIFLVLAFTLVYYFEKNASNNIDNVEKGNPGNKEIKDNLALIPNTKSKLAVIENKPNELKKPTPIQNLEANSKAVDKKSSNEKSSALISEESINSNLHIIVKDEAGNLIENAKIALIEYPSEKIIYSFTTKKDGQAELPEINYNRNDEFNLNISHQEFTTKYLSLFFHNRFAQNKPMIIVLVKGFKVKGVVRDSNGNFLEGVDIHLKYPQRYFYDAKKEIPVIQSKKNGVFEFSNVAAGKVLFSGDGKGFLLVESKKYTVPLKEEIVLVYQKGREHLIKITDIDGLGIAKAKIICFFDGGREVTTKISETDEKGFCSLLLTKEKNKRLIVMHPEYIKYDTKEIFNLHETEPANIILIKGNILRGKITDKATSAPIPSATIVVHGNNGSIIQSSKTNSLGFYELRGLSNHECIITIECIGYSNDESYKIIIEEGKENTRNFELELRKTCRVKLIDSNSKVPIANKKVYNSNLWQMNESMVTDENGELRLPYELNRNQEIYISLIVNGYARVARAIAPSSDIITIELLPSAMLQIFVIDQLEKPLDEMFVKCIYDQKSENIKGVLFPKYNFSNKCFELNGLPIGKSDLTFYFQYQGPIFASVDMVLNAENKINLELIPPYLLIFKLKSSDNNVVLSELSGLINFQNEKGDEPIEGQPLEYNEEMKYFEYSIDYDFISSFSLRFPGHLPIIKVDINKNKSGVLEYEFVLRKGLGVDGFIMNENGQKVTDAVIEMGPTNNNTTHSSVDEYGAYTYTSGSINKIKNQNGNFSAYGYSSGKYQFKVTHYDYIPFVLDIELTNKSITDKQLILKKGAQISGSVSNDNGNLAINAKMVLKFQDSKQENNNNTNNNFYTVTDAKGQFTFKGLSDGSYRLSITSAIGYLENYEIVVSENQIITNLSIKLGGYLEISGVVVDEKGLPLNKIEVKIKPVEENQSDSFDQNTDTAGAFKFINMHNIKYSLNIDYSDSYTLESEVIAMGGDKNVKLILKNINRIVINGHVYLPDGKECHNYSLTYFDIDNNQSSQLIDPIISSVGFQGAINTEKLQTIQVIATAKGFSAGESSAFNLLQYSGQPISITLKNEIELEIRVVDLYSRKPIYKATVDLDNISPKFRDDYLYGVSDEKGQLKLKETSTGKRRLSISAKGYLDNIREIEVAEKNDPIEVLMGKGGILKGQIVGNEKNIASNISVNFFSLQENISTLKTIADENGNYEFKLVPPGKYYLRTEGVSRIQAIGLIRGIPITIEEGKEINISRAEFLSLSKTTNVNISLIGADINKKEIVLAYTKPIREDQNIESISLTSNEEGKVSFLNVPLGVFVITINGFAKPISMPLTIAGDQEINLEIPVE